jgi:hypothetical protein
VPLEPRKNKLRKPRMSTRSRDNRVVVNDRALAFARGELTIEDLDDEEIRRAQFRNKAGDFRGRPSDLVPREFMTEVARQHQDRIFREMAVMVITALNTLDRVMKYGGAPGDMARVKAAEIILQYNIGKVPDKVEIKGEIETWEHRAEAAVVDWGELKALKPPEGTVLKTIIDATVVDEE